jgi:hypothetical protein
MQEAAPNFSSSGYRLLFGSAGAVSITPAPAVDAARRLQQIQTRFLVPDDSTALLLSGLTPCTLRCHVDQNRLRPSLDPSPDDSPGVHGLEPSNEQN